MYISSPVAFDGHTSIFARFDIRMGGGAGELGTDGMAFVIQNSPSGPRAVGVGGGGLGYQSVTPSIAVEFDTFFNSGSDPDGNHVALLAGGSVSMHIAHAPPVFKLNDGIVRSVWIDYDWSVDLIEVYMSESPQRPEMPLLQHAGLPYMTALGGRIHMGASAASGTGSNEHELQGEAWFVTSPLPKCRK